MGSPLHHLHFSVVRNKLFKDSKVQTLGELRMRDTANGRWAICTRLLAVSRAESLTLASYSSR